MDSTVYVRSAEEMAFCLKRIQSHHRYLLLLLSGLFHIFPRSPSWPSFDPFAIWNTGRFRTGEDQRESERRSSNNHAVLHPLVQLVQVN